MRIYKYPLNIGATVVRTHEGAQFISAQVQHEIPCAWAIVDPSRPMIEKRIEVYGTGHDIPEWPHDFIGTFQLHGGKFVGHAFVIN